MQNVLSVPRVIVVLLALLLLPGSFSQSGDAPSELCAAESEGCVVEVASYCDQGDDWIVDHYRKDD